MTRIPVRPWALVLAAGQGKRLSAATGGYSKQFLLWKGVPLYWHSARTLARSGAVAGLVITPSAPGDHCYKMLITPDTHEILYFSRARYRDASDGAFTAAEIRQFERRNGIIP